MGRHGYSDDCDDQWALIKWRGQVASSIRGARGQAFLQALASALDQMPEKKLISGELRKNGEVCAMGAIGSKMGIDLESLNVHDYDGIAKAFGIPHQLVREIEYENDEGNYESETPEYRWARVRKWVQDQIQ